MLLIPIASCINYTVKAYTFAMTLLVSFTFKNIKNKN